MKKDAMLVLQEFEINRLNLEGAEIIAYAVLFKNSEFCNQVISHDVFRSLCSYIEEWIDVLYPGLIIDLNAVIPTTLTNYAWAAKTHSRRCLG